MARNRFIQFEILQVSAAPALPDSMSKGPHFCLGESLLLDRARERKTLAGIPFCIPAVSAGRSEVVWRLRELFTFQVLYLSPQRTQRYTEENLFIFFVPLCTAVPFVVKRCSDLRCTHIAR